MEFDVTIDRDLWIGGSDIPAIMGISSFMTRYQLLLIKAGLAENTFCGNKYTVYGQQMEPQIREYINKHMPFNAQFVPNRVYDGKIRAHTDGFNGYCVLEIKTTSHVYTNVDDYKVYLVQLLKYMEVNKVEHGLLAVYERPEDFSIDFDYNRLQIWEIDLTENKYKALLKEVNFEIDRFIADLERLEENPLLSEEDFQPTEIVKLAQDVVTLEKQLADIKAIEKRCNDAKTALYEAMEKHGVKSWTTPNGTKITLVAGTPASVSKVSEFDLDTFKAENAEMYGRYLKEVEKKTSARSGYVKITLPKGV